MTDLDYFFFYFCLVFMKWLLSKWVAVLKNSITEKGIT